MDDVIGKLHGIPFSVKDQISVKGALCTHGVGSRADYVSKEDAWIVRVLRAEGGIPFVKTNLPILCTGYYTGCPNWGNCINPWNKNRNPGGSSGGEAGLICSGSSPFGLASDSGGSLRSPASAVGICSFMSTPQRLPPNILDLYLDSATLHPINSVLGPMAKTSDEIIYLMNILFSEKIYEL